MKQKYIKVTPEELDAILSALPTVAGMPQVFKDAVWRLSGEVIKRRKKPTLSFYFPREKNADTAVPCIRIIRTFTGLGLKEAKDAFDSNTGFKLVVYAITKEAVEAIIASHTFAKAPVVEWV